MLQATFLAIPAGLRVIFIGLFSHHLVAAPGIGAGAVIFFQEAGTCLALVVFSSRAPYLPWRVIIIRTGYALFSLFAACCLYARLGFGAMHVYGIAALTSAAFALMLPATVRGAYDYVSASQSSTSDVTRIVVVTDAIVQLSVPTAIGYLLIQSGVAVVFGLLAALLLAVLMNLPPSTTTAASPLPQSRHERGSRKYWSKHLAVLVAISALEHFLVAAFFAAFANRAVGAGWAAAEIGIATSLVYIGTALSMIAPVPRSSSVRWTIYLLSVAGLPALIRLALWNINPADKFSQYALLLVFGACIGLEHLIFGVLRFDLVKREHATALQQDLMFGSSFAAMLGAALGGIGIGLVNVEMAFPLVAAVGLIGLLLATMALIMICLTKR